MAESGRTDSDMAEAVPDDVSPIESLAKRVAQLEAENEGLRFEADDLDRQVADLEDELERLSAESVEDEHYQQVAELEAEVETLRNEIAELEAQLAAADGAEEPDHVVELEDEVEALRDENAELESQLAASEANVSDNESSAGLGSDEERLYLGSKNRRHFHRPACKWATYIPDYLLIEFGSHAEAVQAGYKPCKTCRA